MIKVFLKTECGPRIPNTGQVIRDKPGGLFDASGRFVDRNYDGKRYLQCLILNVNGANASCEAFRKKQKLFFAALNAFLGEY